MWRTLAAILLVYVCLDHAAGNAAIRSQQFIGRGAIEQLRTQLWLAPILALALAWWLDRQRQRVATGDEVNLAAERSASPRLLGTLRAAIGRLPWSLPRVYGFVRLRRAHNSERTSPLPSRAPEDLSLPLVQLRDRIDRQPGPGRSSLLLAGWIGAVSATSRRPTSIVWLLLMVPSVMWFVIGGVPQTAALQKTMTQPLAWKAIIWLSVLAQIWLAWRVVNGLRTSKVALRLPSGDDAALLALRAACGVGAVGLGGHALMHALSGFSPNASLLSFFNVTDAYAGASGATGLLLADGAAAAVPPGNSAGEKVINITNDSDLDPGTLERMGFKHKLDRGNTQIWVNDRGREIWRLPPSTPTPESIAPPTGQTPPGDESPPDIEEIQQYQEDFQSQKDDLYRRSKELRVQKEVLPLDEYARRQKQWTDDYEEFERRADETLKTIIPTQTGQLTPLEQYRKAIEVEKLSRIIHYSPVDMYPPGP